MRGLKAHIQKMHQQRRAEEHICAIYHRILEPKSAKNNHETVCAKKKDPKSTYPATRPSQDRKPCDICGTTITKSNWARHRNKYQENHAEMVSPDHTGDR